MDFVDYAYFVDKTNKGSSEFWDAISISGLVGEYVEYMFDPSPEELGDVLWYVFHFINYSLTGDYLVFINPEANKFSILENIGSLAEWFKKSLTYDNKNSPFYQETLEAKVNQLLWSIQMEGLVRFGLTLQQIADINKEKLMKRAKLGNLISNHNRS